jgi:PKD repeat protein
LPALACGDSQVVIEARNVVGRRAYQNALRSRKRRHYNCLARGTMARTAPKMAALAVALVVLACADGGSGLLAPLDLDGSSPAPAADAGGPYTGTAGVPVVFDARRSHDGVGATSTLRYAWDFGDGATGDGVMPEHAFAQPGQYPVDLIVTDSRGIASARATAVVTIFDATAGDAAVLVGAGDIAECGSTADDATAALLDGIGGTVFTLGDNAYPDGTSRQYLECYAGSWGRHRSRTRPAPGNHEYNTRNAAGYFDYFGAAAGSPAEGYYSYEAGTWHVIVLNSSIAREPGSAQERWLRADLAAHANVCTLAYWHHPRFSSSSHGGDASVAPFWDALYAAGADVVLAGHDHVYERFAPQTPSGKADAQRGVRAFVVGTGGKNAYGFGRPAPNSEVRNSGTPGVLKLTLTSGAYAWEFVPAAGYGFRDSGSGSCH